MVAMADLSADFWTCAGNGDGWHSIRETVACLNLSFFKNIFLALLICQLSKFRFQFYICFHYPRICNRKCQEDILGVFEGEAAKLHCRSQHPGALYDV